MNFQQRRAEVAAMHNSPAWREKVSLMPDYQVLAIWHRLQAEKLKKTKQAEEAQLKLF